MRKIYVWIFILMVCTIVSSCGDEWKDELYQQMVSLKAPRNTEGVYDIYLRYSKVGKDTFELPVIISGTQNNKKDFDIKIGVDNDTIATLNMEKYLNRKDLYYKQLPEKYYSFPSGVCHIPAGSDVKVFPVAFNLKGLDLVDKWLLPITIEDDPSYVIDEFKGRGKALLHINLYNDYSGNYSATAMNVYFAGESSTPAVVDTRRAYVVDNNSIFIYAGTTWEEDENRDRYKIFITFNPGTKDEKGVVKGSVTLTSGDASNAMMLSTEGDCTYEVHQEPDSKQPYLMHYYVVLNLNYNYSDITSDPNNPIAFNARGMLTMERKINTLIPDEDQAIQW